MKTMHRLSAYKVHFECYWCNTISNPQRGFTPLSTALLLSFSLFLSFSMLDAARISTRKRNLAAKLTDTNNAAEPEVRMHQCRGQPQSEAHSDRNSSPPSDDSIPETSSNVNHSQEPSSETILGAPAVVNSESVFVYSLSCSLQESVGLGLCSWRSQTKSGMVHSIMRPTPSPRDLAASWRS